MGKKPTYEELEKRVEELEKEAVERKRVEEKIAHLNLVLRAIRTVNQLITREKDRGKLLKATCDSLIETRGYFNAWIALIDEAGRLLTTTEAGLGKDFLPMINHLKRGEFTDCAQRALKQSRTLAIEDPLSTCTDCPLADKYAGHGAITVRLGYGAKVYGLLSASIPRDFLKDDDEQSLFEEVARDIAFALHNIELEEERRRAGEALRESEEKYRSLVESTEDSIYLVDRDCRYLFMNEKHLSRFGLPLNKIIGNGYGEFHSEAETKEFAGKVKAVFETGESLSYEYRSERDVGYYIRTLSPVKGSDGTITAVTVDSKDITERKQAEEALRQSMALLQHIADHLPVMFSYIDSNERYIYANRQFEDSFGPESVVGKTVEEVLDPEIYEKVKPRVDAVLAGDDVDYERIGLTGKGDKRCFLVSYRPDKDESGNVNVFFALLWDITEIKQKQEALRESEEKFRLLAENTLDIISLHQPGGRYMYVSPSCEKILGYEPEELIGKDPYELVHPEDRERIRNESSQRVLKGENILISYRIRKKSGEYVWFESTNQIMKDDEGRIIQVVSISRDITERRQLEEQLVHAQRMEAMGTLAGGIAHDFNNILMGIQGNASLMLIGKTSSHPDYERLKNIEEGVKSGAELTRQLLGFAMGGKYEVKPTDLNELIKRSSNMFGRTKKEITIHRKYQEGIWPVEVDQGQIEQVLINLYVNAWQAMPGGGELSVQTDNVTLDEDYVRPFALEPGRYVKISLADTGVGMDKATQQKIFDPFFTTREMGRGTGLGLASVYGIIKNHDGIINVYSEKGEGTTFTIYLPASEKEVVKEEELPEKALKGEETVLLVDDEEMVLEVGEEILKELGYTVLVARSGREAIGLYRAQKDKIAIVILDMIMPAMGGGETYDRMKEINPNIKVLLSSGYSIDGQAQEILERGCNGFIQKPFTMRELSQEIRKILDS